MEAVMTGRVSCDTSGRLELFMGPRRGSRPEIVDEIVDIFTMADA
jgi:hypothetical protein